MRIVYLHGFASSPQSSKAQFFARKFAGAGAPFEVPELDEGNFQALTITGQLRVLDKTMAGQSAVLMGSSLGGYLAGLYAARLPEMVERLVLMAPALNFSKRWRERFSGEEMENWKGIGSMPFFHYGRKIQEELGYGFVEDAAHYEDMPDFHQPALILHGTEDTVVPVEGSREFAAGHPNVRLKLFHSGHELTDVVESMWQDVAAFLALPEAGGGVATL